MKSKHILFAMIGSFLLSTSMAGEKELRIALERVKPDIPKTTIESQIRDYKIGRKSRKDMTEKDFDSGTCLATVRLEFSLNVEAKKSDFLKAKKICEDLKM